MINAVDALKVLHPDDGTYYDPRIDGYRKLGPYKTPDWLSVMVGEH